MKAIVKNTAAAFMRLIFSLNRSSKRENMRLLNVHGYMPDDFVIRAAVESDIPALAALHVQVWNETYWMVRYKPTLETRLWQWRDQFKEAQIDWFCYVVVNPEKELVGFAKGQKYAHNDFPDYTGELNKLYLLSQYQCLGLGRRLVRQVANRFLDMGITSMVFFGDNKNPSCHFHEIMGGKRLYTKNGEFNGGYGWNDLNIINELL
ncbi:GNAT family N-acetyltransferase [Mucilaginibacter boryungensis]|uniref:GNAT family N-acetyltransferase n=1 Tax=Mucilaginibacter boryungensis TaxID=768480 RepID=A0ABR9XIE7_9SPHI|nr:GNAT family N-acetyltransferase [Mucilaginibacter boryungensis]MBE9667036.1 GNAT family N-acetyltransferase [Mucilaginibacter boryungensis]